jgi:hypothetical protein
VIAERIMNPHGGAGYHRLAGYVLNVKWEHQRIDPASWTRLNAYILDTAHRGEKVAWARATNCHTGDPGWEGDPRHSGPQHSQPRRQELSPGGQLPRRREANTRADRGHRGRALRCIGFEEHQRVPAVHQNTDNWHLRIAINKVHPRTFRSIEPFRDHYRLQEACAELEIRHGLTREPHTTAPEQGRGRGPKVCGRAADFEAQQGGYSFLRWVREEAMAALLAARYSGIGGMSCTVKGASRATPPALSLKRNASPHRGVGSSRTVKGIFGGCFNSKALKQTSRFRPALAILEDRDRYVPLEPEAEEDTYDRFIRSSWKARRGGHRSFSALEQLMDVAELLCLDGHEAAFC